jgi:hypothetical protein
MRRIPVYAIINGTPGDGFAIYLNEQGFPFQTYEEALTAAESVSFQTEWWVVPVSAITDYE